VKQKSENKLWYTQHSGDDFSMLVSRESVAEVEVIFGLCIRSCQAKCFYGRNCCAQS